MKYIRYWLSSLKQWFLSVFTFLQKPKKEVYSGVEYSVYTLAQIDYNILMAMNDRRRLQNLQPLVINKKLCNIGFSHSKYMAENKVCNHEGFNQRALNYPNNFLNENVGYGFYSGYSIVNAWMNSKGHKENVLLKKAICVGISTAEDKDGKVYATVLFSNIKE